MNKPGDPPSTPISIPPEVRAGGVVSGKFRVERVLGEGGMGIVVAATHLQLEEPVALKFLRAEAVAESEALTRFFREAKAAAKLKSEHVARVLDVAVTDEGSPYIVMEYLEGKDLSRTIQANGPLAVENAAEYVIQACEGLAEAHARGIVHRDIKPENLFLVDRADGWKTVKILDFGISKIAMPAGMSNVSTRSIMGSPCYMSPEQLRSTASVDHRTDIWSLGATLFELLSGKTAYDGARTLPELVTAILENPPPRLADLVPAAPAALTAIIARCLEKDRERRFPNAAELAVALLPFAPKRARTSVERAMAMARSAGHSSGSLDPRSLGDQPTDPPPAAPPEIATLRAKSGSHLLVKSTPPPPATPAAPAARAC
jgi:serine/threonine-protein kinase